MDNIIEHKTRFYKFVEQYLKNSRMVYTQDDVKNKIEQIVTNRSNPSTKEMKIYNLFQAFKVIEIGGVNRLAKLDEEDNLVKYICAYEELFDEIDKYHKTVGHGGIHKTLKE
ncbi:KRAB-A domain-containing 2, partial [Brachionus plicatilis]